MPRQLIPLLGAIVVLLACARQHRGLLLLGPRQVQAGWQGASILSARGPCDLSSHRSPLERRLALELMAALATRKGTMHIRASFDADHGLVGELEERLRDQGLEVSVEWVPAGRFAASTPDCPAVATSTRTETPGPIRVGPDASLEEPAPTAEARARFAHLIEALREAEARFASCYQQAARTGLALTGRVLVLIAIDPAGRVRMAEPLLDTLHPTVGDCLAQVFRTLHFPRSEQGRWTLAQRYFVFPKP